VTWFVLALLGAVMQAGQFVVVPILLHALFVRAGAVLLMNAITMVPASYVNSVAGWAPSSP
jgi:hypothetical protein